MYALKKSLLTTCIAAAMVAATAAPAEAVEWTGAVSSDWFTEGNWNGGLPNGNTDVVIDNSTANPTAFTTPLPLSVKSMVVGNQQTTGSLFLFAGHLTVDEGSVVGAQAGSVGHVIVEGQDTIWENGAGLIVGNAGIGLVDVQGNSFLKSLGGVLGDDASGFGGMTVDGANSVWQATGGQLIVGNAGNGRLDITDGGWVEADNFVIGAGIDSRNNAVVVNSAFLDTDDLIVGRQGAGTLTFNGGLINSVSATIGANADAEGTVTVDAGDWNIDNTLTVGGAGRGNLAINGGRVSSGASRIGDSAGSIGAVTVAGSGSWRTAGQLVIGSQGQGSLRVQDNGEVTSGSIVIGGQIGSSGAVTVDGPGASMTSLAFLAVGADGVGTLLIDGGGTVNSDVAFIGGNLAVPGSSVTVANGVWDNARDLFVGGFVDDAGTEFAGQGALTIQANGLVQSSLGIVGAASGSSGTVVVEGGAWESIDGVSIGHFGEGSLAINAGGSVSTQAGILGFGAGSLGTAVVQGQDSIWSVSEDFFVGGDGDASLVVTDRGRVSVVGASTIGLGANSQSAVTVSNAGVWAGEGELKIGGVGTGTLVVDAGSVSNTVGVIGDQAGGIGTATVRNAGTWLNSVSLIVGNAGTGTLDIDNGGDVVSASGAIGNAVGSQGTVNVKDGSFWSNDSGNIFVGLAGTGVLNIGNGSQVNNLSGVIGAETGSNGAVTVDGGASGLAAWNNSAILSVGGSGKGALTIVRGGQVSSDTGEIGDDAGSIGVVTVQGSGSVWKNAGRVIVADQAVGTLSITNGGQVLVGLDATIGNLAGSEGSATVDGAGSIWTSQASLIVADEGEGALAIRNGGVVNSNDGAIGFAVGSRGAVSVSGGGSRWNMAGGDGLNVGMQGAGALSIDDGGQVNAISATVGRQEKGAVSVQGAGSALTVQSLVLSAGDLNIRNGGTVRADAGAAFKDLAGFSDTAISIGAGVGEAAVAAGRLETPSLKFGNGFGTLNFNHTDADYRFDAAIDGIGQINVLAGRTVLTADSAAFGGGTNVQGGVLSVDGTLGGAIAVQAGARLEGVGRVGDAVVSGTIAPGHSIGTLTVDGDYAQFASSVYEAEIDAAGNADRIAISGAANLDGKLVINGSASPIGARYTLITAAGGVAGQFAAVDNAVSTPFLDFKLRYDPNAVFLDVARSALTFASLGGTRNQIATGTGLDRLNASSPLLGAMVGLDLPAALGALDPLSGEIHASTRGALVEDSRFARDAATERLRSTQGDSDRGGWARAFGNSGRIDRDGNAAETDIGSGGVLVGADMAVGNARLGVMGGTGRISVQADERHSKANSDSLYFGAYAGTHWGAWGLRAGALYGRHDVETERKVAFGSVNEQLRANYDERMVQGFVEAGYRIDTEKSSFEPYLNLAQVGVRNDGYQETGGIAALRGEEEDTDTGFATLGVRATSRFKLGGMPASLHGGLGWRHAFGDVLPLSHHAFAGGDTFVIAGAAIAEDAAVASARLDLRVSERASLGLGYSGQVSGEGHEHSVQAQLQVKF